VCKVPSTTSAEKPSYIITGRKTIAPITSKNIKTEIHFLVFSAHFFKNRKKKKEKRKKKN
jgi:hypothetical protein